MSKRDITGAGQDYFKHMGPQQYRERINTPARSPEYFHMFHEPIVQRAKQRFGPRIRVLDVACGPADELEFIKNDPNIQIIATDISPAILSSVKGRLDPKALVFASDAKLSALREDVAEAGMLVNAVVYVPDKMLETMYRALRPGGECAVNFRVFSNPHNQPFYDYYVKRGGKILDNELTVQTQGDPKIFNVKILDYTECVNDEGAPDMQIRQLVQQIYFESVNDIQELIQAIGFDQVEYSQFNFASPVNPDNQIDVFILRKPIKER